MEGASRLGTHLGPILVQLPPDFEVETDRLAETLAAFPAGIRVTFEPRHRSWSTESVTAALEEHGAALCWADRRGPLTPERAAADWGYVRFHGGRAVPRPCYGPEALEAWVGRVRAGWPPDADVFAYFNNDHNGCAPRDAAVFTNLARNARLSPTRVPSIEATPVGR
jgi:uncharacterized protein YecE (DUF72 family)